MLNLKIPSVLHCKKKIILGIPDENDELPSVCVASQKKLTVGIPYENGKIANPVYWQYCIIKETDRHLPASL